MKRTFPLLIAISLYALQASELPPAYEDPTETAAFEADPIRDYAFVGVNGEIEEASETIAVLTQENEDLRQQVTTLNTGLQNQESLARELTNLHLDAFRDVYSRMTELQTIVEEVVEHQAVHLSSPRPTVQTADEGVQTDFPLETEIQEALMDHIEELTEENTQLQQRVEHLTNNIVVREFPVRPNDQLHPNPFRNIYGSMMAQCHDTVESILYDEEREDYLNSLITTETQTDNIENAETATQTDPLEVETHSTQTDSLSSAPTSPATEELSSLKTAMVRLQSENNLSQQTIRILLQEKNQNQRERNQLLEENAALKRQIIAQQQLQAHNTRLAQQILSLQNELQMVQNDLALAKSQLAEVGIID
mgnify:CR=1 FL=1